MATSANRYVAEANSDPFHDLYFDDSTSLCPSIPPENDIDSDSSIEVPVPCVSLTKNSESRRDIYHCLPTPTKTAVRNMDPITPDNPKFDDSPAVHVTIGALREDKGEEHDGLVFDTFAKKIVQGKKIISRDKSKQTDPNEVPKELSQIANCNHEKESCGELGERSGATFIENELKRRYITSISQQCSSLLAMPKSGKALHRTKGSDETMEYISLNGVDKPGARSSNATPTGKSFNAIPFLSPSTGATVAAPSVSQSPRRDKQARGTNSDDILALYTSQTLSKLEAVLETCVKKITLLGSQLEEVKVENRNLNNRCNELSQQVKELMLQDNGTDITEISLPSVELPIQGEDIEGLAKVTSRPRRAEIEKSLKKVEALLDIDKRTVDLLKAQLALEEAIEMVINEIDNVGDIERSEVGWCVLM
ncbi:hypothetical protein B7463_g2901, partial [Scytalidium lignicola]